MEKLNRMAIELVDEALEYAAELNVGATQLDSEATILDFGLEFDGGMEAGLLCTEIQTAGLATVRRQLGTIGTATIPYVELSTDQPALALLGSQKAGWELTAEDFEGLGSGPARALVAGEDIYQRIGYSEHFDLTALAVETDVEPTDAAAEQVAAFAGVEPSSVFLVAFPTASVVGSVTNAARAAEVATYQLCELGYDPLDIVSANGRAPVAPIAADERTGIARTTDALAYGGRAHLVVRESFDRFEEIPSTAGEEYESPFAEIYDEMEWSFEELPAGLFGPATVTVDVMGGETHTFGETDEELLIESFGL
ncbi:methenyltetrahydromethanopterin cyclohydrolase [Halovivax gelatinilyticus]|uniref:methenyltetrahydromethanopterin cyclohydrolase n=1 Tax=Halovivax gelatinilyticus TaxID=2961597 RepID=UPI0020CA90F3|nr:methenyltetrahydromethanopterin cyclohydrolase [Halovivax gelatinilyticus]